MLPFVLNGEYIIDAVKAVLRNNSIDIYHADGSINTYSYIDSNTAQAYYNVVKLSQTTTTGIIIVFFTPATFDAASATNIVIHGSNFPQSDTLVLHIEDTAGGLDDNGYTFACSWQDSNTLLASFSSAGDAALSSQNYVYIRDTTPSPSTRSNVLMATWPGSGTIITVQQ